MTTPTATQIRIRVPSNHLMIDLLGERDAFLKQVDAAFPKARIIARAAENKGISHTP